MRIESVKLENFRNYRNEEITFHDGINVIAGANAQGKTNLLESIFYLSCGHGFRTRTDRELIAFDSDWGRVQGRVFSGERQKDIEISMGAGVKKQVSVNSVRTSPSELSQALRVVLFSPEDLNIIKDGAKERRRFMDLAISQLRPNYARLLSEFNRLFEHKKRILSDWREKPSLLEALDEFSENLNRCSAHIIRYRAAYVKRLAEAAAPIHREFSGSGEDLTGIYKTVSTVTDAFAGAEDIYREIAQHQKTHREAEIASGSVLTGIHKDDIEICINGVSARQFASQGQTRTAALSLKMAEREISYQDTNENPVLLLDDVLSELDAKRQEYVLNRIKGGQTFITCCEDEQVKERTGGRVFFVSQGKVSGPC